MDYKQVYASGAGRYQELVGAEDADGNLLPALATHLAGLSKVVEIGAGTGRVTRLLQALDLEVVATEPSSNMLHEAVRLADAYSNSGSDPNPDSGSDSTTGPRCSFCLADAASLPLRTDSFDAAIAGWVYGHQREWRPHDWRDTITGFLTECDRVTANGTIIVIETLGTGHETPHPSPELTEYYAWLEQSMGFSQQWIRTDYEFSSVEIAAEVAGSFFGPDFGETVRERAWARIPECTGIWVRTPSR